MAGEIQFFRYRERMHLSYVDAINEPLEEVNRAILIWSLDAERDKLESERRKMQQ